VDRRCRGVSYCECGFAHLELEVDLARRAFACRDLVANRAALHADDLLQTVAAIRGGGEA
jgi:hypothetical protein